MRPFSHLILIIWRPVVSLFKFVTFYNYYLLPNPFSFRKICNWVVILYLLLLLLLLLILYFMNEYGWSWKLYAKIIFRVLCVLDDEVKYTFLIFSLLLLFSVLLSSSSPNELLWIAASSTGYSFLSSLTLFLQIRFLPFGRHRIHELGNLKKVK